MGRVSRLRHFGGMVHACQERLNMISLGRHPVMLRPGLNFVVYRWHFLSSQFT
jgi:hypothetical protein